MRLDAIHADKLKLPALKLLLPLPALLTLAAARLMSCPAAKLKAPFSPVTDTWLTASSWVALGLVSFDVDAFESLVRLYFCFA